MSPSCFIIMILVSVRYTNLLTITHSTRIIQIAINNLEQWTAVISGPLSLSRDLVADMSLRYLMANIRLDFHVVASSMADNERFE